jgi:hypothetical protein
MDKNLLDIFNYLMINGINDEAFEKILSELTPEGIKYNINRNGNYTALFVPTTESIDVSIDKVNNWVLVNTYDLKEKYRIQDRFIFSYYLFINLFIHEIQHSKQYLISTGKLESYKILQEGYKCIFDLMEKNKSEDIPIVGLFYRISRLSKLIKYDADHNSYCLERDANIESFKQIRRLAKLNNHDDINKIAACIESTFIRQGYDNTCDGALKQTLTSIGLKKKYDNLPKDEIIDYPERVRYGLEVDEIKGIKL